MGYRKRRLSGVAYRQHSGHKTIASTVHMKFQVDFDKGYDEALKKAQELEKDGWIMTSPVTVMQDNAKTKMGNLGREGYETEFVPAAEWQGEKMGIILFREKPKPTSATKPAQTATAPSTSQIIDFASAESKFLSTFKNSDKTDEAGAYLSGDRYVALILPDAKPDASMPKIAKRFETETGPTVYTVDLASLTKPFVKFGVTTVNVQLLRKAIKVLGGSAEVVHYDGEPLVVRKNGVILLIAPAEPDDPVTEVTDWV